MLAILKKQFSVLTLASFIFHSLFPTIAFAMDKREDNRKQSIFSPPPTSESQFEASTTDTLNPSSHPRKSSDFTEELKHKTLFEPLIDTRTESLESESSESRRALPHLQSLSSDEDQLIQFANAYPLYEDLEVGESLLCWKRLGFEFMLHAGGDLFVKKGQKNRIAPSALRLFNPNGDLILGDQINVKHLLLKAKNVVHQGENQITNLEVWTIGDEELRGVFQNTSEAELKVSEILLHQGYFQNRGNILNLRLLKLNSGINEASISAKNLRLIVHELFSNAQEGYIGSEASITTEGSGTIIQEGCFNAPNLFINNTEFEERAGIVHTYNDFHLGSFASRYSLSKGMLWAKSVLVDKDAAFLLGAGEHLLDTIENKGLISLFNKAHIKTQALLNSYGTIESTESLRFIALFNGKIPKTVQRDIPTITITKMEKGVNNDQTLAAKNLRAGTLTARDDLILEFDPRIDIFKALDLYNDKWRQGRKLMIYGDKLLQTKDFIRGGHSVFHINEYINPGYSLTGNALEFFTVNPPTIGSSNDRIGKIVTVYDPSKPSHQDNRLTFTIEKGDVYLHYADIFGHGKTKITLLGGNLVYGGSPVYQTRTSDISPNGNYNFNYGPDEPSNFNVAPYSSTYKAKNKSHLGSNAYIEVSVPNYHTMTFAYTTVEAKWYMELFARGGSITNLSSKIQANGRITPYAYSYTNTRDQFERLYSCPYRWNGGERMTMYKDFETSDRAELLSVKNSIYFEVMKVLSDASDIKAFERVFNNKNALKGSSSFKTQSRTLGHRYLNRVFAGGLNLEEGFPKGYGITEELTAADNLVEAKVVDLAFREQQHDGHVSAKEVILQGDNLSMKGDPSVKVKDGRPPAIIDAGNITAIFQKNIILKNANLKANENNLTLTAFMNLIAEKTKGYAKNNINLSAGGILALLSKATREGAEGNYQDTLNQTVFGAGGKLVAHGGVEVVLAAIHTHSGEGTTIVSDGKVTDQTVLLEKKQTTSRDGKSKKEQWNHHASSHHQTGGGFSVLSKGEQNHYAPKVLAEKDASYEAFEGDINFHPVHNTHLVQESIQETKKSGFSDREIQKQSYTFEKESIGADIRTPTSLHIITHKGNISLKDIKVKTPQTTLEALNGIVSLLLSENTSESHHAEKSSDFWWNKQSVRSEENRTYSQNEFTGSLIINSKAINVEVVKGQTASWLERIQLQGTQNINYLLKEELHKVEKKSHEGPTAALSAVIALAASAATSGLGSTWGLSLGGTLAGKGTLAAIVIKGMTMGVVSSLSSQAAIAIVSAKGDLGKAAESLANSNTLKSILISAVTGGALEGIADCLNIPLELNEVVLQRPVTFVDHFNKALLTSTVDFGANVATGERLEKAIEKLLHATAVDSFMGLMANKIGGLYDQNVLNFGGHKMAHAFLGGMTGILMNPESEHSMIAGAMGAFVAETFADLIKPDKPLDKMEELAKKKGRRLTQDEYMQAYALEMEAYKDKIKHVADLSKVIAATSVLLSRQDVHIAIHAAKNSVENNFLVLATYGLMAAGIAWSAYNIKAEYEANGAVAALKTLGIEVALAGAGGIAFRVTGKTAQLAVKAALERNPALRLFLGETADKLIEAAGKLSQSQIGQLVSKAEQKIVNLENKALQKLGFGGGKGQRYVANEVQEDVIRQADNLLPAPKMVKHHLFNKFRGQSEKSEKYRLFFKQHNIEIDDFAVSIPQTMHVNKIHAAQKNWTTSWKQWIDQNPHATTKEVYQVLGQMMDEYGISHLPIIPYRK